eukprot:gene2589-30979_t
MIACFHGAHVTCADVESGLNTTSESIDLNYDVLLGCQGSIELKTLDWSDYGATIVENVKWDLVVGCQACIKLNTLDWSDYGATVVENVKWDLVVSE